MTTHAHNHIHTHTHTHTHTRARMRALSPPLSYKVTVESKFWVETSLEASLHQMAAADARQQQIRTPWGGKLHSIQGLANSKKDLAIYLFQFKTVFNNQLHILIKFVKRCQSLTWIIYWVKRINFGHWLYLRYIAFDYVTMFLTDIQPCRSS